MSVLTEDTKIQVTIKQLIAILAVLISGFGVVLYTNDSNYKSMKGDLEKLQKEEVPKLKNEIEFSKGQITILINATSKGSPQVFMVTEQITNTKPK